MYIIQEIQTNAMGEVTILPAEIKPNRNEAESFFYSKCGSACNSTIPIHSVITYTEEGFYIPELTKCFKHAVTAANPIVEEPEVIDEQPSEEFIEGEPSIEEEEESPTEDNESNT